MMNYTSTIIQSMQNCTLLQGPLAVPISESVLNLTRREKLLGGALLYIHFPYSLITLITSFIIYRIISMTPLKSNIKGVTLPIWSKVLFHISALVPLLIVVTTIILNLQTGWEIPILSSKSFLRRFFIAISWSRCIQTFLSTTTNTMPLSDNDYNLFELSIQFHYMTLFEDKNKIYSLDIMMELASRIVIHILELLNLRSYWFISNTILRLSFFVYLLSNFNQIPYYFMIRESTNILSLTIIIIYSIFSGSLSATFNSIKHQREDEEDEMGEEGFSTHIFNLATYFVSGNCKNGTISVKQHSKHIEINPETRKHSYILSGYLIQRKTNPEDFPILTKKRKRNSIWTTLIGRILNTLDLLRYCFIKLKTSLSRRKTPFRASNQQEQLPIRSMGGMDLNKFIDESNYRFILTKMDPKLCLYDPELYLLPESDTSPDYIPEDIESISDSELDFQCESDSGCEHEIQVVKETDHDELLDLLFSEPIADPKWYLSIWSILTTNKSLGDTNRLTRLQYSKLNQKEILQSVIFQMRNKNNDNDNNDDTHSFVMDDDELELKCLVCEKHNRNIVLWPCKCLAICEHCRVTLGSRGFKSCVSCSTDVESYTKLNIV